MFEVTKIVIFCLTHFAHSEFKKLGQLNLSRHNAKVFLKYFYFSSNSLFGIFILVFPFHGNVVSFRENFVCLLHLFLSLKTHRTSLLSLLFMIEIPTFTLLFQNFEPYFIPTFSVEATWKPVITRASQWHAIAYPRTSVIAYRHAHQNSKCVPPVLIYRAIICDSFKPRRSCVTKKKKKRTQNPVILPLVTPRFAHGAKLLHHCILLFITFDLICNMTMFVQNWF